MNGLDGGLSTARIDAAVREAGLNPLAPGTGEKFSAYYDLLVRWNAKLNLTAIRSSDEILRRHFVECIFCAQRLPTGIESLLDYGSGAGFPGIPIALCRPNIRVTLAESQGKKASFLREAVRELGIEADVYAGRVEEMPVDRQFDGVTLRAVDRMQEAVERASLRVVEGRWLVLLANPALIRLPEGFLAEELPTPGLEAGVLVLARRLTVPRGTVTQD